MATSDVYLNRTVAQHGPFADAAARRSVPYACTARHAETANFGPQLEWDDTEAATRPGFSSSDFEVAR